MAPQIDIGAYDRIVFHFDGNNNDPDDIAAVAVAALLARAGGLTDRIAFFYGNNLAEATQPGKLARLEESAAFARSLGIATVGYEDDIPGGTAALAEVLNSGEKVLILEGGPMEATYRALALTDPANLGNVTQVSHSAWNENRDRVTREGVTEARTWDDIAADFPGVAQIEIADQNAGANNTSGFNNRDWSWMDGSDDPVIQEARAAMIPAGKTKRNDPSDAGMLFWALTGEERGTALDAQDYLLGSGAFGGGDGGEDGGDPDAGGDLPVQTGGYEIALVDTRTDEVLAALEDGDTIDLALVEGRRVGLAVTDAPEGVESMRLVFGDRTQVESVEPYAVFGDKNGNYRKGTLLDEGAYALELEAFAADDAAGDRLAAFTVAFDVAADREPGDGDDSDGTPPQDDGDGSDAGTVPEGFAAALVDTRTDTVIVELSGGDTIDFALLEGRAVGFAITEGPDEVESLRLTYGARTRVENVEPYALLGDKDGNYRGNMRLEPGEHEVALAAYDADNAGGDLVTEFAVGFTVI